MKLKMGLAFVALYIAFLLLTAPASLATRFIPKNSGLQIGNTSGTLWNGKLAQLDYRNKYQLQQLTWEFDWFALLTLQAKADIKFNNGEMSGLSSVAYGLSGVRVTDTSIDLEASALIPYLDLPVVVTPSGKFTIIVENATQGAPYCGELDGYLVWHDAEVETPIGNIDLGMPSMELSCADGGLIASVKQHSEQLTTNADIQLTEGERYRLSGSIMGHEALDPNILQAISWIGPKNPTGETPLFFEGKL